MPGMLTSGQLGRLDDAGGGLEPELGAFTRHVVADQGIEIGRMRDLYAAAALGGIGETRCGPRAGGVMRHRLRSARRSGTAALRGWVRFRAAKTSHSRGFCEPLRRLVFSGRKTSHSRPIREAMRRFAPWRCRTSHSPRRRARVRRFGTRNRTHLSMPAVPERRADRKRWRVAPPAASFANPS